MAVKATYTPAPYVDGDSFYNGIPARNLTDEEWALLTSAAPVTIATSSVADPTVITTSGAHGLTTGDVVTIAGHSGSTPAINGRYIVTVLNSTTFTIPVAVTGGGTGGTVTKDSQQGLLTASPVYTIAP